MPILHFHPLGCFFSSVFFFPCVSFLFPRTLLFILYSSAMPVDQAKLAALKAQGSSKIGGQRVKTAPKAAVSADQQKVITAVNRLGGRPVPNVTEACIFLNDQNVLLLKNPKVVAAAQANTWAFTGKAQKANPASLGPSFLEHLGMNNIQSLLSQISPDALANAQNAAAAAGLNAEVPNFDEAEEAPDLVDA